MTDSIVLERDGAITKVLLNRPQAFNAFDFEMIERFSSCLMDLAVDDNVRGLVITGAGKAFCAGGDLKWALAFPQGPAAAFHALAARLHLAIVEMQRIRLRPQ